MKRNYNTVIIGQHCLLVPYRPEHVERYHTWMQDPDLLQATGSEPLSLQEEYEMQASWRSDDAKCTFIVLARNLLDEKSKAELTSGSGDLLRDDFIRRTLCAMVGDVNLFLSEEEEEEQDDDHPPPTTPGGSQEACKAFASSKPHPQAELDVMVAEKSCRGKGVGREACCLMMLYGATHLSIRRFYCKINQDNEASLGLFRNKLNFRQCGYASCFQQFELELKGETPSRMIEMLLLLLGSESELNTRQLTASISKAHEKTEATHTNENER